MIVCAVIPDVVSYVERAAKNRLILLASEQDTVTSASIAAVRLGVTRGMRLRQARSLCPDAVVVPFRETAYRELAESIEGELHMLTTYVEPIAPFWYKRMQANPVLSLSAASWYLDIGKLTPNDALAMVKTLGGDLRQQFSLHANFGLAAGKFPATVATFRGSTGESIVVRRGEERAFLARSSLALLPLSRDAIEHLQLLGMTTIGQVADLPRAAVAVLDGKRGQLAHRIAQGDDPRKVIPRPIARTERIERSFDGAIENGLYLDVVLSEIGEELARRLATSNETLRTVELILSLDRGNPVTGQRRLHEPTGHKALIGRALMRLRAQLEIPAGVTGVTVIARDLAPVTWQQLDLFGQPVLTQHKLEDLLTALADCADPHGLYAIETWEREHLVLEQRFRLNEVSIA